MRLKEKIAVITGAAAGIGLAAAKVFLQEGAIVILCDMKEEALREATEQLKVYGIVKGYALDITDKQSVEAMVAEVAGEFGRVDILINNAGITKDAQFYKMTQEEFDSVINVNLRGTYIITKAVLPYMMKQNYGKIVNASSVSAYNGNFGQCNYAASKAAISGMTRVMGKELGKYGINVNAVAAGTIMTEMYAAIPEEVREKKLKEVPLHRYGKPEEVGRLYAFLASDEAAYITSQTITIDGGRN
ncbi:MAG: 3-oxoacyl-ACP reductase FabG [Firmicutes bacterium]|nr:3-oxoacyl-ACP reductase FabG [Bacillota bacterium]